VDNLERLIKEFLVFSKPYEIEKNVCNPEFISVRTQRQVERLARDKDVIVDLTVDPNVPQIAADTPKMVQALSNLLRNAIEVSPPASHVAFHICKEDRFVCFRISDQGPGVDPALGDGIFNAFVSKKQGGTGLGLSIVHRIVSGHGGTIRFFNADTGGAVFEVRLPA
jgi:signal transduction histidine kinase